MSCRPFVYVREFTFLFVLIPLLAFALNFNCKTDRTLIMKAGRLRCAGSSLFLKTHFGFGYSLSYPLLLFYCSMEHPLHFMHLRSEVSQHLPESSTYIIVAASSKHPKIVQKEYPLQKSKISFKSTFQKPLLFAEQILSSSISLYHIPLNSQVCCFPLLSTWSDGSVLHFCICFNP